MSEVGLTMGAEKVATAQALVEPVARRMRLSLPGVYAFAGDLGRTRCVSSRR